MIKLQESLNILDTLKDCKSKQEVIEVSKHAFETCLYCLEAACIIFKLEDDEYLKENFLINAIADVEKDKEALKEEDVLHSLKRGYFELAKYYLDHGKYLKARDYFIRLEVIDIDDYFKSKYYLFSIACFLEEDIKEEYELLSNTSKKEDLLKLYLPYALYLYKMSDFEGLNIILDKISTINEKMIKILKNEISEEEKDEDIDEALKVIKNNAYIINSCPHFLEYLKRSYD